MEDLEAKSREARAVDDEPGDVGDILVVDDNPANILAIQGALSEFDFEVQAAHSGAEALRRLLAQDFALILLDVQMPGMDGFETARLIRNHRRAGRTPIIFITAYDRSDRALLQAYELGAVDFLFKPVEPVVLRAKVSVFVDLERRTAEVLRQARLLREHERRSHEQALAQERSKWKEEALLLQMQQERRAAEAVSERADELARIVAERERAEQELTRINRRLEEGDRRKDEFLAVLAHELRNPLAPLTAGLEILREHLRAQDSVDPVIARTRDVMARQIRHMTRLIDDLLDVSRIASGKIKLDKANIDINEVLQGAVSVSETDITSRSQDLVMEPTQCPVVVYGDVVRLTQIVANLLNNASRYTPDGGQIRLSCHVDGDEAVVTIMDTGEGMEPEFAKRIFDMFVQQSPGRGGLGVGLTLVRRLVGMHGGRVTVHSDGPGKGSSFSVRLPLATGDVEERASGASFPPTGPQRQLRVVLVDDNADLRLIMQDLLESWGHSVDVREDGREGAALIVRDRPDVAIVDLGLPELDGYGVARQVRAELGGRAPRLVAMSGFGAADSKRKAFEVGFDEYLVKPASTNRLREVLAAVSPAAAD